MTPRPPSHSDDAPTAVAAASLDDTVDDEGPRFRTGPVPRVDPADFATHDLGEWEWARQIRASVVAIEHRVATAEAKADAATRKLDKASKVVWSGAGLIGVGVVAVVKLAFSAGDTSASTRQHLAELTDVRAAVHALQITTLPDLRAAIATNTATIAGLRSYLDQISRLGAVRVQGPPPQPLLPGDP